MLLLIWVVLCLVASSMLLLPLVLWRHDIYRRYSGSRLVTCPKDQGPGVVTIDARHAMATGVDGNPDLHLSACTRGHEHSDCSRACLSQATQAVPYLPGDGKVRSKQIYHLPILLAAFAAWYLGAAWHSPFMFRARWLDVIGLSELKHGEIRDIVGLYLLVSAAGCLLCAYGVAWLLAVCHRRGVLHGVLMSAVLCGTVIVTNWPGIARLPHELLVIETGYTVLTVLIVGAIVGGLYNKLVVPPLK